MYTVRTGVQLQLTMNNVQWTVTGVNHEIHKNHEMNVFRTVRTGVRTLPALSVGVAADSSPRGRAKDTHGICGNHG